MQERDEIRSDIRYIERGSQTLQSLNRDRRVVGKGIAGAASEFLVGAGIAESSGNNSMVSDKRILSLGCGSAQIEQMVFGRGLKGLGEGYYCGVDMVRELNTRVKCPGEIRSGVDILGTGLDGIVEAVDPDVLLDIDTLPVIVPASDNLDRYIDLVSGFLTKKPGGKYLQLLTYPASRDWWSPPALIMNPEPFFDIEGKLQSIDMTRKSLYILSNEELGLVAERLLPTNVIDTVLSSGELTLFFEHIDGLVRRYIVDGERAWGSPYRSFPIYEDIVRIAQESGDDLPRRLIDTYIRNTDLSKLRHKLNSCYAIVQTLVEMGALADYYYEKAFYRRHHKGSLGLFYQETFRVVMHAFQVAGFETVMQRRFAERGLMVEEVVVDGKDIEIGGLSSRLPAVYRDLKFPHLVKRKLKRLADRRDWMCGVPLFSRRGADISGAVEAARLVGFTVEAT